MRIGWPNGLVSLVLKVLCNPGEAPRQALPYSPFNFNKRKKRKRKRKKVQVITQKPFGHIILSAKNTLFILAMNNGELITVVNGVFFCLFLVRTRVYIILFMFLCPERMLVCNRRILIKT